MKKKSKSKKEKKKKKNGDVGPSTAQCLGLRDGKKIE